MAERENSTLWEDAAVNGLLPWEGRAIILLDLDAFFASVEQLDHPEWRGKPVIVGGDPDKHGVVSTASYEARRFGVRSAMPSSTARQLCPDALWTHGHFARYKEVSKQVMALIYDETPHVQQVSIDEAFADISPTRVNTEHPIRVAQRIQSRVDELGVSCSIGLATTKTIAKIASDMDKPHGLTVVMPGSEAVFLRDLPVGLMSGVGKASREKLHGKGIDTIGQLAASSEASMERLLGKNGVTLYRRAICCEDDPIESDSTVKSVSNEVTFAQDLTTREDIEAALASLAGKVGRRLRAKGLSASTLGLKIRYDNRSTRTVQRQLPFPSNDDILFSEMLSSMIDEVWARGLAVRLLGVSASGFEGETFYQEGLFSEGELGSAAPQGPSREHEALLSATDRIKDRFGENSLSFGHDLRHRNNLTGSAAKNPADYLR